MFVGGGFFSLLWYLRFRRDGTGANRGIGYAGFHLSWRTRKASLRCVIRGERGESGGDAEMGWHC